MSLQVQAFRRDLARYETIRFVGKSTPGLMLPAEEKTCRFRIDADQNEVDKSNNESDHSWNVVAQEVSLPALLLYPQPLVPRTARVRGTLRSASWGDSLARRSRG